MNQGNLSRRGFLGRSLAALTAGAGLPAWYAREVLADEQQRDGQRRPAANDRLVFGIIGIGSPGGRAQQLYNDLRGTRDTGWEVAAVCDVDRRHRERAAQFVEGRPRQFEDYRDLLQLNNINCVIIATPDHWHAQIAIAALRAGKDVYCEKPLTLTIDESKAVARVARQTNRIFQTGSQQRSDARFRLACELVRNGRIGRVRTVETRIGANPQSPSLPRTDVPDGLNWNFWLGPTPQVDYVFLRRDNQNYTRCHYEFRWWYDYSGGKMTDWGAHHNDIAQWGLGMDNSGPVAIEGRGDAPSREPNSYNCHPHFTATYTYANGPEGRDGTVLRCTDGGENGIRFDGEDGKWIFVSRGTIRASDGDQRTSRLLTEPLGQGATRLEVSNNHMRNFLECVRGRRQPICNANVGHRSVTVCHLGNIAIRTGLRLRWDPREERFTGDNAEQANRHLSRERRAPWDAEWRRVTNG
jgi:predicted dehydrogenase